MKKILALVLALALVVCASLALAEEEASPVPVMTYEEYCLAEIDAPVTVEAYVQATQAWWEQDGVGQMTIYLQNEEGGFFAYNVKMTKEESEKLVPGTKIRISGFKAEWSGEVEIVDAKYEILEAEPFIAEPEDVTALLGTDELVNKMNRKVAFKGVKVAPSKVEGKDDEFPFLYSWDGSGSREGNSDLYFNVEYNGAIYSFTVESYLCDNTTPAYLTVENLNIGDTIYCEGFLYWYNGAQPHITGLTITEQAPAAE